MIKIQTLADVQMLKRVEHLPSFYIEEINNQFLWSYEAENEGEEIDTFTLPSHACIYHLNDESDWQMLQKLVNNIEYVDTEVIEGIKYFRIGVMQGHAHEMSVIYFLEGTLPYKTEKGLLEELFIVEHYLNVKEVISSFID